MPKRFQIQGAGRRFREVFFVRWISCEVWIFIWWYGILRGSPIAFLNVVDDQRDGKKPPKSSLTEALWFGETCDLTARIHFNGHCSLEFFKTSTDPKKGIENTER